MLRENLHGFNSKKLNKRPTCNEVEYFNLHNHMTGSSTQSHDGPSISSGEYVLPQIFFTNNFSFLIDWI